MSYTLTHGVYATPATIGPEVDELAERLAPLVPAFRESDSPMVQLAALALRRVARAEAAIAEAEEAGEDETAGRLANAQRQWANSAVRIFDLLAMSPTSRARLGLDVALTRRHLTVADLHAQAEAEAIEAEAREDEPGESDVEEAEVA